MGVFVTAALWNSLILWEFYYERNFSKNNQVNTLFFVSVFNTNTWKKIENTSSVLILHYSLIKANSLHKTAVYLVCFCFRKHFSVHNVEWQQRNKFRKAGRFKLKKDVSYKLVVKIIGKWLWRTLSFSLICRLQARSVTKKKYFICIFQWFGLNSVRQPYWAVYKRTHIYNALILMRLGFLRVVFPGGGWGASIWPPFIFQEELI